MQIDIDERERKAMQLFKEGYNCAQSVALAFSDIIGQEQGMSEEQIGAAMTGFGGGFGRLREVCGTVSGMTFVAGCVCPASAVSAAPAVYSASADSPAQAFSSSSSVCPERAAGSTPETQQQRKARNYELVQSLANAFRQENGSIICRELLGMRAQAAASSTAPTPSERTAEYYKARPCEQLVGIAARILATKLAETGN